MTDTPNLGMTEMEQSQSQKHVTFNEALHELDAIVQLAVIDKDLSTPPGSPTSGDRYIVASGATGDWSGAENSVAAFQNGAWTILTPKEGWVADVNDEGIPYRFDGSVWAAQGGVSKTSANNATFELVIEEELLTLTGGAIVTSVNQFPNKSIPLFASVYNIDAITGPAGMQWYLFEFGSVAITHESGFGGNTSMGQQQRGPANPMKPVFSNVSVSFEDNTATAGSGSGTAFTGGDIRLTIAYWKATPANS